MKSIFLISNLILSLSAIKESTDLYIFGDSLSDNGNTWVLTGGKRPNGRLYPEHKYTNGLVWNEYLTQKYPNLNLKNYAVGGATTDNSVLIMEPDTPSVLDQTVQVANELSVKVPRKCGQKGENKRLAVIWGGGNDFVVNATIAAKSVIPNLLKTVNVLKQTKKFDNIFVFNLVNVVKTPLGNSLPDAQKVVLNQVMIQINQALAKTIKDEQAKDSSQKLTFIDVDQIAAELISSPPQNSIKWEPLNFCIDNAKPNTTEICKNPEYYFFYDNRHPNTVSHKSFALKIEQIFRQLNYI